MRTKITEFLLSFIVLNFISYGISVAQINYTDLSPGTKVTIPDSTGVNYYNLDLNYDGITDFRIGCKRFYTMKNTHYPVLSYVVFVDTAGNNRISPGPYYDGDTINGTKEFISSGYICGWIPESGGHVGRWYYPTYLKNTIAHIGLEFHLTGITYYGWLQMKTNGKDATITKFAWNGTENEYIYIGQTQ